MAETLKLARKIRTRKLEIDGVEGQFDVLDINELPMEEALEFRTLGEDLDQAFKDETTKEQRAKTFARLRVAIKAIVPQLPDAVKLTDMQRMDLLRFFLTPAETTAAAGVQA